MKTDSFVTAEHCSYMAKSHQSENAFESERWPQRPPGGPSRMKSLDPLSESSVQNVLLAETDVCF